MLLKNVFCRRKINPVLIHQMELEIRMFTPNEKILLCFRSSKGKDYSRRFDPGPVAQNPVHYQTSGENGDLCEYILSSTEGSSSGEADHR